MLMYVFDRRWHTAIKDGKHVPIHNKLTGKHTVIDSVTAAPHAKGVIVDEFMVEPEHSIATIGVFIHHHAKKHKIKVLYLCSHGNAGYMEIGTGLDITSQAQFKKLDGYKLFAPEAVVELHGCNVASAVWVHGAPKGPDGKPIGKSVHGSWKENGIGHQFMKALAKTLGVRVRAGIEEQTGNVYFKFVGKVVTVAPDGKATLSDGTSP